MSQFPAYQTAGIAARWGCYSCCTKLDPATLLDTDAEQIVGTYIYPVAMLAQAINKAKQLANV